MKLLQFDEGGKSFDGVAAAGILAATAGTPFAVPGGSCAGFAWQTKFDVNPDAIAVALQISLDGENWTDLDTSTAVAGETKYKDGYAKFVRGYITTVTIGSGDGFTLDIAVAGAG